MMTKHSMQLYQEKPEQLMPLFLDRENIIGISSCFEGYTVILKRGSVVVPNGLPVEADTSQKEAESGDVDDYQIPGRNQTKWDRRDRARDDIFHKSHGHKLRRHSSSALDAILDFQDGQYEDTIPCRKKRIAETLAEYDEDGRLSRMLSGHREVKGHKTKSSIFLF